MRSEKTAPEKTDTALHRSATLMGGVLIAVSLFALSLASATAATADARVNIVFILADDLGWKDVGYHDSDIKTPNLDKLAQTGVRLEQFYSQQICTPARAAFMTGRYPLRYGLQMAVIPSAGRYGLATDEWLLPQALKQAGYRTAIVGKWHLGHIDQKYWPNQRGFDYSYGPLIGEIDHFKHESHGVTDWYRNNKLVKEQGYDTQLFGADAVRQIEAHDTSRRFSFISPSPPRTHPIRRRGIISTAIKTSPIRSAAPMRRKSPAWTTRSARWSRRWSGAACATTLSLSLPATMAAPVRICSSAKRR